jgi:hypothetical protein
MRSSGRPAIAKLDFSKGFVDAQGDFGELGLASAVGLSMEACKRSHQDDLMTRLFNPDDWLARHPGCCLSLLGGLVLAVDWIAPLF